MIGALSEATDDQIVLALITILGTTITGLIYIIKNNLLGKKVNQAVNNIGPGEHPLIDMVRQVKEKQEEFDKRWGNLPDDMDDAVGLAEMLHGMSANIETLGVRLDRHIQEQATQFERLRQYIERH